MRCVQLAAMAGHLKKLMVRKLAVEHQGVPQIDLAMGQSLAVITDAKPLATPHLRPKLAADHDKK